MLLDCCPPHACARFIHSKASKDWQQAASSAKLTISSTLADHMPALLARYKASAAQSTPLAGMLCEMSWDVYSLKNKGAQYEALLRAVGDLLFMHADAALVEGVCVALTSAVEHAPAALRDRGARVLADVAARVKEGVVAAVEGLDKDQRVRAEDESQVGGVCDACCTDTNAQELFNARAALLRLQRLSAHCDALACDAAVQQAVDAVLQVSCLELLYDIYIPDPSQGLSEGCDWGASIACLALLCGFTALLWRMQQCRAAAEPHPPTTPASGRARGRKQAASSAAAFDELRAAFVARAIDTAEQTKVRGCSTRL